MIYIFLLIFLLFIVVPIVKLFFQAWTVRRRMQQFFRDPFAAYGQASRNPAPQKPAHKKKITRDVGEYVAFSEVETTVTDHTGDKTTEIKYNEQQITDVEWEDLDK